MPGQAAVMAQSCGWVHFNRRNSMVFGEETGKDRTEMVPVRERGQVALRRRLFPALRCGVEPAPHPRLDQFALASCGLKTVHWKSCTGQGLTHLPDFMSRQPCRLRHYFGYWR